jgi:hypothetical protein
MAGLVCHFAGPVESRRAPLSRTPLSSIPTTGFHRMILRYLPTFIRHAHCVKRLLWLKL